MRGGAASFTDVTSEYLALRREAAFLTDWHDVVWVRGPDAVTFLDGLVSQAVAPLEPGEVAPSLLLGPRGKLRAPHWLLKGSNEVGLVTDAGIGEVAAADLRRFKIRVDVVIEPEPLPVLAVLGPDGASAVERATGIAPSAEGGWKRWGDMTAAAIPFRHATLPRFVVVGPTPEAMVDAGIRRAGRVAGDAARIEVGEPLMGVDIDESTIPQEAGLVAAGVDFDKGCYLGQELVARIDSRGHVNRRLGGVVLGTNVLPPPGAELVMGDRAVGALTSVAESLDLRAPIALAMVRSEVEPGSTVTVRWEGGAAPAEVRSLPLLERF